MVFRTDRLSLNPIEIRESSDGMLYKFVWVLARIAFKSYFRKIYLIDKSNVPRKGPVLMACTHPSSFMEACLLATFQPRSLHFLTRGDVFRNPIFRPFLSGTHQIPIYRARDGFENLRKNDETFKYCYEALGKGKTVIIFPESRTIWEKKLRPIQKGTARMAFGAKKANPEIDLKLVPVGVNFEDPRRFQSDVIIKFGAPISIEEYWNDYQNNERESVSKLTSDLETKLKKLVFSLKTPTHERAFSTLDIIYKNENEDFSFPEVVRDNKRFSEEFKLASELNILDQTDPFIEQVNQYQNGLESLKINDRHIQLLSVRPIYIFLNAIVGTIPWLLGRIFVAWPGWIADKIAQKKVKEDAFLGPVKLGIGIVLNLILVSIIGTILIVQFGWWGLIITAFIIGLAYFVARFFRFMKDSWQYLFTRKRNWEAKKELLVEREKLKAELDKIIHPV